MPMGKPLTCRQVSERTGIAEGTIYDWSRKIDHPFPKPFKVGTGHKGWRWDSEEIARWLRSCMTARDRQLSAVKEIIRQAG